MHVLPRSFYDRDPLVVARQLLGKLLMRKHEEVLMVGEIVETEAYLAKNDPASHAYRGPTNRNAAMFGPPGHAYIYAIRRYHCLNVVTEGESVPSAVLIRAVEPLAGVDLMQVRRRTDRPLNLTSGPGKLCEAFAIDRTLNRWDVTTGHQLWFAAGTTRACTGIVVTKRIGVTSAGHLPRRFYVASNPFVSRGPRSGSGPHASSIGED